MVLWWDQLGVFVGNPDAAAVIAGEVTNLTANKLYCNFIFVFFSQFIFAKLSFSFNPVEGTLLDEDIWPPPPPPPLIEMEQKIL